MQRFVSMILMCFVAFVNSASSAPVDYASSTGSFQLS